MILGIETIDLLIVFLLASIIVGIYLNLMVFDRLIERIEDVHQRVHVVDDFLGQLRVDGEMMEKHIREALNDSKQILFEDGEWP
tara:strand:+ start:114 stop:365 length:252 start_codon:yes stop_codon:yes gene_type:complete